MKQRTEARRIINAMVLDLVAINGETGNVAACTLCEIQDDLYRIVDSLIWGG